MFRRIRSSLVCGEGQPAWKRAALGLIAALGCLQVVGVAYGYSVSISCGNCDPDVSGNTTYYNCYGSGSVAVGTNATLDQVKWYLTSTGEYLGLQIRQLMQDLGGGSYNYSGCDQVGAERAHSSGNYGVTAHAYIEGNSNPVASDTATWTP